MGTTDNVPTELRQHWPGEATELYLREAGRIEAMNGPFGDVMLDAAELGPGERVLDVGCGYGSTTLEAAPRVLPGGAALGVDVSASMLGVARQRAMAAGIDNVEFVEADAQVHPFEKAAFDAAISRFGVMFFDDSEAAFANVGRAVRHGGRLVIVCPSDPLQSEWVAVAFSAAAAHVGLPDIGPPGAPGPFAFADAERLERTIRAGGFRDVTLEAIVRPIRIGDNVDDVAAFITSLPEGQQLLTGKPADKVAAAIEALREGFAPHAGPDGVIVNSAAWLASARR
jgi:ubiquinone/menaquinone biosynthesis C-methylase UbiE